MARSSRTVQDALNEIMRHDVVERRDVALYVAAIATELVALSKLSGLETLAYLADMMRVEAEHQAIRAGGDPKPDG